MRTSLILVLNKIDNSPVMAHYMARRPRASVLDMVDGLVQKVESLEKEIEEGQNAIAPLIPYSNLLLDDGSR